MDSSTCFTLIEENSSELVHKRNRLDGTNPTESILPLNDSSIDDSIPGLHHWFLFLVWYQVRDSVHFWEQADKLEQNGSDVFISIVYHAIFLFSSP